MPNNEEGWIKISKVKKINAALMYTCIKQIMTIVSEKSNFNNKKMTR